MHKAKVWVTNNTNKSIKKPWVTCSGQEHELTIPGCLTFIKIR